jgi:predicted ester cyclase
MRGFFAALPDVHATEQHAVETLDTVAMRFVVEGSESRRSLGVAPNGRKITWDADIIYRLVDGTFAEQGAAEDWAGILQQSARSHQSG